MDLVLFLGISLCINGGMFVVAFWRQTDALTDLSYALSFVALVTAGLLLYPFAAVKVLLAGMVALWAIRLGIYLVVRIRKIGRDRRFDGMRHDFWKFGRFWLGQAVSVWVILLATIFAFTHTGAISHGTWVGVITWAVGLVVETFADAQKFRYVRAAKHNDRWIESGLWRYSRHPNYFGEILVWVGIYLVALPNLAGSEVFVGLLSPLCIVLLLLFVSGIPPLERRADAKWGDDPKYQAYKARTSLLIPLPPKRN